MGSQYLLAAIVKDAQKREHARLCRTVRLLPLLMHGGHGGHGGHGNGDQPNPHDKLP